MVLLRLITIGKELLIEPSNVLEKSSILDVFLVSSLAEPFPVKKLHDEKLIEIRSRINKNALSILLVLKFLNQI
jgi:hypothetical protein